MALLTLEKKRYALRNIIAIFTIIVLTPCFALGYSVSYEYYVYADDTEWVNMPITTPLVILDGETSVSGEVRQDGNTGNYAAIKYSADLAAGGITTYEYAQSDNVYKSSATGRMERVGFSDILTFTLEAGTYDDDVEISLLGVITGSLYSNLDAGARIQYYITFDSETLFHDYTINPDVVENIDVNDPISFTKILVKAGTELLNPTEFSYNLLAIFANVNAWATGSGAHSNSYNTGTYQSVGEVDFYNTLQFTDVIVPDGVTWTSESGVFLSHILPPILTEVTPVPTPANDTTPDYTFNSDEAGTITYGGSCSSTITAAISGDNTITFSILAEGIYNDCTITVTDSEGNASIPLAVTPFMIDTTAPILTEVTPVLTPANDITPDYTFNSDEAGIITYGGRCISVTASAAVGNNTITFNTLAKDIYSDCTITVTDITGNDSITLNVTEFIITFPWSMFMPPITGMMPAQ